MSKKIPIGVDDFSELVSKKNDFLFVDKTLFIKEILDDALKVCLIIRPRRWGKTINMSMLRYFFAPRVRSVATQGLFDSLKIARENHGAYLRCQGKHPVIFISFKAIKEASLDGFFSSLSVLMAEIYSEHRDILINSVQLSEDQKDIYTRILRRKADNADLQNALKFLSLCLEQHYKQKVIILIDEYDTPLNMAYEKDYFEQAVGFFKNMFGAALKGNDSLEKGIMTGILRLSKNSMLSDLNNLKVYSLMDERYNRFFGFSEEEVKILFAEQKLPLDLPLIQKWYNGYRSGSLSDIYNPWSILNCIYDKGMLDFYWIKTGDERLLNTIFIESGTKVKEKINTLLSGGSIESVIDDYVSFDQIKDGKEEVLWSLLWALGYLKTVDRLPSSSLFKKYRLQIPNYEVESSYRKVFMEFIRNLKNSDTYDYCLHHLIKGEVEAFAEKLQDFMLLNMSYFDCSYESNYPMLLLGMSSYLKETHDIFSNLEQGKGRPDLLLVPKDTQNSLGIILEFKRAETGKSLEYYKQLASQGLEQINKNHYDINLKSKSHLKQLLKLCVVFYGKELAYEALLESVAE